MSQNGFADDLKQAVTTVNDQQQRADILATAFHQGDPKARRYQVILSIQKVSAPLLVMRGMRNRLVNTYQEIMNRQV